MKHLTNQEIEDRLTPGNENYRDFSGCELSGADFSGLDLTDVLFIGAYAIGINFAGCNLSWANLANCCFIGVDFRYAVFHE